MIMKLIIMFISSKMINRSLSKQEISGRKNKLLYLMNFISNVPREYFLFMAQMSLKHQHKQIIMDHFLIQVKLILIVR